MTESVDLKTLEALNSKYFSSVSEIGDIDFRHVGNANFSLLSAQPTAPPQSVPPAPRDNSPNAPENFITPDLLDPPAWSAPSAPPLSAVLEPPPSFSASQSCAQAYSHHYQSFPAAQSSHSPPPGHQSQALSSALSTYPQPDAFNTHYTTSPPSYASANYPEWRLPHYLPTVSGAYPQCPKSPHYNTPSNVSYPGPPPPPPPPAPPHPQALAQSCPQLPSHSPLDAYVAPPLVSAPNLVEHLSEHVNIANTSTSPALQLRPVGFFKDLLGSVEALPATRVASADDAAARVVELKHKLNELQKKRASYHARQAGTAASTLFTGGAALLLQGPAVVHQRNRLQQILRAMREVIVQINQIRAEYGATPGWNEKEGYTKINDKVFTKGLRRRELEGAL